MMVGWGRGRRYQDWLNRTRPTVTDKGVQGMSVIERLPTWKGMNIAGDDPSIAVALVAGTWLGESDVLPTGAAIEVLAVDAGGRFTRHFGPCGVPARTACWIRHWPPESDHAQYRSCDLADLDLAEDAWDHLFKLTQATAPEE
jgi:hypothetical protein